MQALDTRKQQLAVVVHTYSLRCINRRFALGIEYCGEIARECEHLDAVVVLIAHEQPRAPLVDSQRLGMVELARKLAFGTEFSDEFAFFVKYLRDKSTHCCNSDQT